MGLIIGQGTKSGGGGGDVRLETNHNATISDNGTHVVTPQEGYDGMRKATIKVDVEAADPADKALVNNATQYGLAHNLYKVMDEVKADSRTQGYAAIMLCQYYKGYNSLSLEGGADAFLTSDGDFYQGNAVHYWHDSNDEHFDRWVAMLFSSESGSYTCSNTSICPRAALIDGTMGNIVVSSNYMRFAWIDVTNGSSFGNYSANNIAYTSAWNRNVVIRGMRNRAANFMNLGGAYSAVIGVREIAYVGVTDNSNTLVNLKFDALTRCYSNNGSLTYSTSSGWLSACQEIRAEELQIASRLIYCGGASSVQANNLRRLILPSLVECSLPFSYSSGILNTGIGWASLVHIEIGQGFRTDFNLSPCSFANCLKTDSNDLVEDLTQHPTWSNLDQWLWNFEHLIVDKLADLSGQTAKTITLAAAPYAAITEQIRQKMSEKNWNLASA